MSAERLPTNEEIMALHRRLDEEQIPVIHELAVTRGWGFGRIIQLCHQLWDSSMALEYGIAGHSRQYAMAEAQVLLEQQAKKHPELAEEFLRVADALSQASRKMS